MRPQFSLKTMLWVMAGACSFMAMVALASTAEGRLAVAGGLLLAIAPLASGIALAINAGRSRWLTVAGWAVACVSLAAIAGIAVIGMAQEP
jgi:hypothetical protein